MTTLQDAALRLAVFQLIADLVKAADTAEREALTATLKSIGLTAGSLTAELPDGTVVGSTTLKRPSTSVVVADDRKLLAWVREHHPEEVEERVRPAFITRLKDNVKRSGEAVPGLEVKTGKPGLAVTVSKQQAAVLMDAVRNRLIDLPGMLALEAAEAE